MRAYGIGNSNQILRGD